jgi:glutathione synthase/RimK-type ligase-like ATP-grasp enzyme
MPTPSRPIAIYHEHQEWFRPLFAEMDRRGTPYVRIDARRHHYDVAARERDYSLVFNRMSPSAYLRGTSHGIYHTLAYLEYLEQLGTRVVNGSRGFRVETSKASQLSLLASLGLKYPPARVINHPAAAPAAAEGLRFPVVVKANLGGSGAGIVRYDTPEELAAAAERGTIDLGIDSTALVQEFVPARGGYITRVEVLDRRAVPLATPG